MAAATTPRQPSTVHDYRAIAVRAHRDPRTVVAAYEGKASPLAAQAVADAAEQLGYLPPLLPPTRICASAGR